MINLFVMPNERGNEFCSPVPSLPPSFLPPSTGAFIMQCTSRLARREERKGQNADPKQRTGPKGRAPLKTHSLRRTRYEANALSLTKISEPAVSNLESTVRVQSGHPRPRPFSLSAHICTSCSISWTNATCLLTTDKKHGAGDDRDLLQHEISSRSEQARVANKRYVEIDTLGLENLTHFQN